MKRFLPLFAVAALIAVPAASARPAAPPTLQSGKLIVAFGDPAPGFASGTVRGNTITNPRGYEVDLASAIAREARAQARVDVLAVEQPVRAGHEEVRHLVPGGDDHVAAEADGRLHHVVPEREPGRADLEADDGAEEPRRPEAAPDLRPDEHDGPRLDQDAAAPGEGAARVPDDDRRVPGRADQPLPGDDPRRAARVAAEEAEAGRIRARRRPGRDARAVRRRPAEGLEAARRP